MLRIVLEEAPQKLTRRDIFEEWPDDFPKPCLATLWLWLKSAVAAELVQVEGTGMKSDPFRYWVAAALARWRENPLYELFESSRASLRCRLCRCARRTARRRADSAATTRE
ncbi:MAG: hypothetical protein HY040_09230 [Planctomycetes bacterium]|nr:hypothetical protein [Planctomycetota bacterium]